MPTKIHFKHKGTNALKGQGWKKIHHASISQKEVDFRQSLFQRQEYYYIVRSFDN